MRKSILSLLFLLACAQSFAQTELSNYRPGVTEEGAIYYLPKTAMRFVARIEKTTYTPGEFSGFANQYMFFNDVSSEPSVNYRLLSLSMTPVGVADTAKCYAVKFDAKATSSNMVLGDDGILLAINANAETATLPEPFVAVAKAKKKSAKSYLNSDILSAGSKPKMAELIAQEIFDIRDSKNQLNRGEADFMPKDGAQLKIMLANLDEQEEALTELFKGTTDKDTMESVIMYCPIKDIPRQLLFRLSKYNGMVDNDDLSGTPYYIYIEDLKTLPAEEPIDKKRKKVESGIYVNVPSKIRANVVSEGKTIESFEMPAAQYGRTELLSGELFSKKYATHLVLDPTCGAVKSISSE